jgi:aminoglycoside phosphotransferase (APT) family kinase protein
MRGPHRAQRASAFAAGLADPRIPVPIGCVGAATVERWVDGSVLASLPLQHEHVTAAADLLATLHRFPGLRPDEGLPRARAVAPVGKRAGAQLRELATAGRITDAERDSLQAVVEHLPATSAWGLTHNDFCGSNLVLAPGGSLVSIDNEHLVRGFLAYDLARVRYRWPMSTAMAHTFERAYGADRRSDSSADETRAWRLVATLKGAHLRHRIGAPNDDAVAALRALIA